MAEAAKGSRRCSICLINFPNHPKYQRCVVCDLATHIMPSAQPITSAEAEQLRTEVAFANYLDSETDEVKTEREKKIQEQIDRRYSFAEHQRLNVEFDLIVKSTWTIEERYEIEQIELRLPYARPPITHE
jgi:hypothetical protein